MKPLGTITNSFPFLEKEVSTYLESLMENSLNYADFLDEISKQVLENESPPMMVFYTVVHLHRTEKFSPLELIVEKYQDFALVQPFIMKFKLSLDEATVTDVLQSADRIALNVPNSWVVFEMHCLRSMCATTHSVGSTIEEDALTQLQNLIDTNSEMYCFKPRVLDLISSRLHKEGKIAEALEYRELERTQALSCDDIYQLYDSYVARAYLIRNLDAKKAHELLDKAKEIKKELGFDVEEDWGFHNIRATVHNARGELDLSLQCYQKAIHYRELQRFHTTFRYLPINMSYVYGELEDGENALEWAKMGMASPQFITGEPLFLVSTLTRIARAFVLLGDIEQAETYLEKSQTESLKVGSDSAIAENHIVAGYIEKAKGNFETAMFHFERGLEIAEQITYQNRINSCLIGLVKTEIAMFEFDESNDLLDTSGPWMKLMQSEINRKDLPGIQGVLLLLKTELRLKQGRIDAASNLLKDIRSIAKRPGLKYLGRKADELQSIIELESGR